MSEGWFFFPSAPPWQGFVPFTLLKQRLPLSPSIHPVLLSLSTDEDCVNCTEECRVLGHSDRCWMPQFPAGGNQAEGVDYRNNMFVPVGMESVQETENYEPVNPNGKKTFCTFGKERRDHTILIANVKPYLKAKRALSPLLQEVPSASSSPTKGCSIMPPCSAVKSPADGAEGKPPPATCSGHYGPPDGQYLSPTKHTRDQVYPSLPSSDPVAKMLAEARSRISQETAGEMESVLEQAEPNVSHDGMDTDQVVRDIDKLLQDCRGSEATGTLRKWHKKWQKEIWRLSGGQKRIPLVPKLSMSPKLIKKVKRLLEAPFTAFVVDKYLLRTMGTFNIQHFSAVIPTNWKKLRNIHMNFAEFINCFCFWILKLIPEASASGTSQTII